MQRLNIPKVDRHSVLSLPPTHPPPLPSPPLLLPFHPLPSRAVTLPSATYWKRKVQLFLQRISCLESSLLAGGVAFMISILIFKAAVGIDIEHTHTHTHELTAALYLPAPYQHCVGASAPSSATLLFHQESWPSYRFSRRYVSPALSLSLLRRLSPLLLVRLLAVPMRF